MHGLFLQFLVLFVSIDTLATAFAGTKTKLQQHATANSSGVRFHPNTFSAAECASIVELMKTLPVQYDDRVDKSVKRTNYFETKSNLSNSKYTFIFERIAPSYGLDLDDFISSIDFLLLHEFENTGFFDWHVDTKPGDGTGRTVNINVMLSQATDYQGGVLTVGSSEVAANQGDSYSYPASFPHKVGDITDGRRHTLVIAMFDPNRTPSQEQHYWDAAEANHETLCLSHPNEPKLHMLHGEFLAALGRPDLEVDGKFADMYACTAEAVQYANNFEREGQDLVNLGRIDESKGHLAMAEMIRERL